MNVANACGSLISPMSGTLRFRVTTSAQSPWRDIRNHRSVAWVGSGVISPRQAETVKVAGILNSIRAATLTSVPGNEYQHSASKQQRENHDITPFRWAGVPHGLETRGRFEPRPEREQQQRCNDGAGHGNQYYGQQTEENAEWLAHAAPPR
jgi:hypothetical protein